jgi:hypothetical protein
MNEKSPIKFGSEQTTLPSAEKSPAEAADIGRELAAGSKEDEAALSQKIAEARMALGSDEPVAPAAIADASIASEPQPGFWRRSWQRIFTNKHERVISAKKFYEHALSRPEEALLGHGAIVNDSHLSGGRNESRLIEIEEGGRAVFKPASGERWRFVTKKGSSYKFERAAYLVDRFLGFDLVPPTVIRDISGEIGSVQQFVDRALEPLLVGWPKMSEQPVSAQTRRLALFDCLIANIDRHQGNSLLGHDDKIWAIDHGFSFNHKWPNHARRECYKGMFFGDAIEEADVQKMLALDGDNDKKEALSALLLELLGKKRTREFFERLSSVASALRKSPEGKVTIEQAYSSVRESIR